ELLGETVKGGDPPAAEIAYENGITELAEVTRSPDNSPGRVEPIAMFQAILKFPFGTENVDETEAGTTDGIVAGSILLGVSNKQAAAYVLDIKGSEASGNAVAVERVGIELYAVETGVVNLDRGIAEIGDIKESIPIDFAGSHSLVDRTVRRAVIGVVHF